MNEIDVLKKISSNLTERKNSAALSNYRVLCSNIAFLNEAFSHAIRTLRVLHCEIELPGFPGRPLLHFQADAGVRAPGRLPQLRSRGFARIRQPMLQCGT